LLIGRQVVERTVQHLNVSGCCVFVVYRRVWYRRASHNLLRWICCRRLICCEFVVHSVLQHVVRQITTNRSEWSLVGRVNGTGGRWCRDERCNSAGGAVLCCFHRKQKLFGVFLWSLGWDHMAFWASEKKVTIVNESILWRR